METGRRSAWSVAVVTLAVAGALLWVAAGVADGRGRSEIADAPISAASISQDRYEAALDAIEEEYLTALEIRLTTIRSVERSMAETSPDSLVESVVALDKLPAPDGQFSYRSADLALVEWTSIHYTNAFAYLIEAENELTALRLELTELTEQRAAGESISAISSATVQPRLRSAETALLKSAAQYTLVPVLGQWPRFEDLLNSVGFELDEPGVTAWLELDSATR